MKRIAPLFVALLLGYFGYQQFEATSRNASTPTDAAGQVQDAYVDERSGVQVRGSGRVSRILADDNDGSRHQRFILELQTGHTVLIVHNIDLAPRISDLRKNDAVEFFGEYEWNPRGGLVHWTHHDPNGSHVGGWLEHEGKRYQ
jgi:hypothetical protein